MNHPSDVVSYNTPHDFAAVIGCLILTVIIVYVARKYGER